MARILIVSQTHICRNPRTVKEAVALSKNGHSVTILTTIYSHELLQEDLDLLKGTTISYDFYSDLRASNFTSLWLRLLKKAATTLKIRLGIESIYGLGYGVGQLFKKCLEYNADLYIMHQELPLVAGCTLLKKGFNVFFDIEDWYSEDLLTDARKRRPIALLKKSEQFALQRSACCYTTSFAMAGGLIEAYPLKQKPHVVYNSFNALQHQVNRVYTHGPVKLYWFSQTIGPGRGLEFFIEAMAKSNFSWDLTLRGNIANEYHALLNAIVATKDRLSFQPMLRNEDILSDMGNYDIGLALEPNIPPNKNLTISNKFFHYLAAGLPVIASDTLGHLEIGAKHPDFVFIYKNNDVPNLILLLNRLGNQYAQKLQTPAIEIIDVFNKHYCWQIESEKLVSLINQHI